MLNNDLIVITKFYFKKVEINQFDELITGYFIKKLYDTDSTFFKSLFFLTCHILTVKIVKIVYENSFVQNIESLIAFEEIFRGMDQQIHALH